MMSLEADGGARPVQLGDDGKPLPRKDKADVPEANKAAYESAKANLRQVEAHIASLKAQRSEKAGKKEPPLTYAGKTQEPGQSDYAFVMGCVTKGVYELGGPDYERHNRETDEKYEADLKKAFEAVAKQRGNPLKVYDLELLRKDDQEREARMMIASMEQQLEEFKKTDRPEFKEVAKQVAADIPGFIKQRRDEIIELRRGVAAIKDARRKAKDALKPKDQ
jgi:hypothetical protein